MRSSRLLIVLLVGLAAILAVGSAFASEEGSTDEIEAITITLQPGDNFVGWVDESLPLDELLVQVPGILRVSTWDAVDQRELSATVDANRRWSGPLQALQPGAAYIIHLGGDAPVEWSRPIVPAAGLIELRTGENWVAWLGLDGWAITDVAKGIGKFLSEIRLGDHVYDPTSPETADDWPMVSRGDALVVTVSRGVNWLQPTYVLPRLIFTGRVDQGIRNAAKRDLADMAAYNAEEFGVQADPFQLTVIVPGSLGSLTQELERQGRSPGNDWVRNWWRTGSGGFGGADVNVIKAEQWERSTGRYSRARYVLLEEYYHAIQGQLAADAFSWRPTWMVEGSINWIRGDLATQDRTGFPLSRRLIYARNQATQGPPLEEIEVPNATWQYSFGLIAADLLIERAGTSAFLDFFRAWAPGRTGSDGQWESQLTWHGAFAATYGISVKDFYAEFEEHMHKHRGNVPRRKQPGQVVMRGTVVNHDGSPRPGVRLLSQEVKDVGSATFGDAQATSGEDGEFALFVRRSADHRIRVELADQFGCSYWWTSEGDQETRSVDDAELIEVGATDPPPLTIKVDGDQCRWRISGTLFGPDDEPLSGVEVRAQRSGGSVAARTGIDGSFELVANSPGTHQLYTNLGGCRLYWGAESSTEDRSQAGEIQIVDQNVPDIQFKVPADFCTRYVLAGRLLDSNGNGIEDASIYAHLDDDRVRSRTDSMGRFELTLTETGEYYLYAFPSGCRVYHRPEGATGLWSERSLIAVSQDDVRDIVFQLEVDMCTLRVAGTLLNADRSPRSGVYVRANDGSLQGGDRSSEDGGFSFTVPAAGSYKLNVTIDGCRVFYGGEGVSGGDTQARALNLSRSRVANIRFVLPENPCLTIEGHLLDSSGEGIEGIQINARADGDPVWGRTDSSGWFQIALSEQGDYLLHAWIDGCLIYYGQDGITAQWSERTPITIADDDFSNLRLQLEPGMCTLRISGQLLNADGSPESGHVVRGASVAGLGGAWPSGDGSFSFAVPASGFYKLWVTLDGCEVYYVAGKVGAVETESSTITLSNADVTGIEFRLPENPASFCD